jgi:hypothetical protein
VPSSPIPSPCRRLRNLIDSRRRGAVMNTAPRRLLDPSEDEPMAADRWPRGLPPTACAATGSASSLSSFHADAPSRLTILNPVGRPTTRLFLGAVPRAAALFRVPPRRRDREIGKRCHHGRLVEAVPGPDVEEMPPGTRDQSRRLPSTLNWPRGCSSSSWNPHVNSPRSRSQLGCTRRLRPAEADRPDCLGPTRGRGG